MDTFISNPPLISSTDCETHSYPLPQALKKRVRKKGQRKMSVPSCTFWNMNYMAKTEARKHFSSSTFKKLSKVNLPHQLTNSKGLGKNFLIQFTSLTSALHSNCCQVLRLKHLRFVQLCTNPKISYQVKKRNTMNEN